MSPAPNEMMTRRSIALLWNLLLIGAVGCSAADSLESSRTEAAPLTVTRYEETSPAITYVAPWGGTWYRNNNPGFSAGSHLTHMDVGAKATFQFTGSAVTWIGYRDPW